MLVSFHSDTQLLDLISEVRGILDRLDLEQVPYALCGGLAMAIHGYPRATVAIDVLAPAEQLPRLLEAVRPVGYDIAQLRGDAP